LSGSKADKNSKFLDYYYEPLRGYINSVEHLTTKLKTQFI